MTQENTFKVNLVTNVSSFEINLLDDSYLHPFGVTAKELLDPSVCYDVPGYLYTESGEASSTHPCAGSACMVFPDPYGQICSIDFISYYDFNPTGRHAEGRPHWNNEIRLMRNGTEIGRCKDFDGHVIEDCGEITLKTEFNGDSHEQTIYRRDSVEPY